MPNTNPLIEQMQKMLRKPATDYGNMIWESKYGNQGFNPDYDMDYTRAPEVVPEDEVYEDMLMDAGYFPSQDKNTFGYYSDDPMDFYNAEAESDLLSDFYNEDYGYPENMDDLYNIYYELNEPSVINRAKTDPELQKRINKINTFFNENQL